MLFWFLISYYCKIIFVCGLQLSSLSYLFESSGRRALENIQKKGLSTLKEYEDSIKNKSINLYLTNEEFENLNGIIQEQIQQLKAKEIRLAFHLEELESDSSDDDEDDQSQMEIEHKRSTHENDNQNTSDNQGIKFFLNPNSPLSPFELELNTLVQFGQVTEVFGLSGAGKTCFCLSALKQHQQMCQQNNSQVPQSQGRTKSGALVVDFENGLLIERLMQILSLKSSIDVQQSLAQILLKYLFTEEQIILYMRQLISYLDNLPDISLVILDGFISKVLSFGQASDFNRKYSISQMLMNLRIYAQKKGIAVIITNTLSFERQKNPPKRPTLNPPSEQSAVFHSFVDNKLYLTKGPNSSSGFLIPVKLSEYAPNIIEKKIPFKILESGISFSNE